LKPTATNLLVILETIIFILTLSNVPEWASKFGFSALGLYHFQAWTLMTSLFIHANVYHLAINMFFVFVFGTALEAYRGRNALLICFFAGGAVSLLLGIPLYPSNEIIIGSSIAISSVIGAVLVMMPFKPAPIFLFRAPLGLIAIIYLIFNLFFAYYGQTALGIAYPSHVIGFFVGIAIALVLRVYQRKRLIDARKISSSSAKLSGSLS
jgi:membrane associated rhomboid family serine protease